MEYGKRLHTGESLYAKNSAAFLVIPEMIKEYANKAGTNFVSFDFCQFSYAIFSSTGSHLESVKPLTVYFPAFQGRAGGARGA